MKWILTLFILLLYLPIQAQNNEPRVKNISNPQFYLGNSPVGETIDRSAKTLSIKYPDGAPLPVSFRVITWEMTFEDLHFSGNGSQLTKEVTDRLKVLKSGTQIAIIGTCVTSDGPKRKMAGVWKIR